MSKKHRNDKSIRVPTKSKAPLIASIVGVLALAAGVYAIKYISQKSNVTAKYSQHYREISFSEIEKFSGVEKIIATKGDKPEVIFITQEHPPMINSFESRDEKALDSILNIEKICNQLYDNYNVRSALFEGLDESFVNGYNAGGNVSIRLGEGDKFRTTFVSVMQRTINGRRWNLYCGEKTSILDMIQNEEKPIAELQNQFTEEINKVARDLAKEIFEKTGDEKLFKEKARESFSLVREKYQAKIKPVVTKTLMERIYNLAVVQRNHDFAMSCKQCKTEMQTPIIVVLGYQHWPDFMNQIGEMNYVILQPKDLSNAHPTIPSFEGYCKEFIDSYAGLPVIDDIKVSINRE